MRSRLIIFTTIGAFLLTTFILGGGVSFLADRLWFISLNHTEVFYRIWWAKLTIFGVVFTIVCVFMWINFQIALHLTKNRHIINVNTQKAYKDTIIKQILGIIVLSSAWCIGIMLVPMWDTILQYYHQAPVGKLDPIFGKDISFYLFSLPIYYSLNLFCFGLIGLTSIYIFTLYFLKGLWQLFNNQNNPDFHKVALHITCLAMMTGFNYAWYLWIQRYFVLYNSSNVIYGASYTDHHVRVPIYVLMSIITVLCSIGMVVLVKRKKNYLKLLMQMGTGYIVTSVILLSLYPTIFHKFLVEPNELEKEIPYIKNNIEFTKLAYALDHVDKSTYAINNQPISVKSLHDSKLIKNIRLWDWRPLLKTYKQLQEIRLYYKFHDVDVDRYTINDEQRQVMVAARELAYDQVPQPARTWVNHRLKYTHGYGVVMSPVNRFRQNGMPEFFIKDVPPLSVPEVPNVEQPEIYYGEETNHYILTGTNTKEFDYPLGKNNQLTLYKGKGGIPIPSFLHRLLYALHWQSIKILISNYLTEKTRIHYVRNIKQRVHKIAPFLSYDSDPYIIIANKRLYWIIDAYTQSHYFPYAKPTYKDVQLNYIRNSVKVVVNAYNGDVAFVVMDEQDPILQTYRSMFPKMFHAKKDISREITEHFRYPTQLFWLQANIYTTYHMEDVNIFYNREDMWKLPTELYEGNEQMMEPYYITMQLPGQPKPEFLLILPFTPVNKNNMVSWMAVNSNSDNYGRLILYEFPKKQLVYGPMQIEARIDQDPEISELLTLWSQKGSNVIRGNLMVLPVDNSILYVEPLYIRAEKSQMPELKRVIVSNADKLAMGPTLELALDKIMSSKSIPTSSSLTHLSPKNSLVAAQALSYYQRSIESLKQSKWSAYGKQQKELGKLLRQLKDQLQ